MDKKPTLTVGIPVHNEEKNIAQLIADVLAQRGDFTLEKVLVMCDGCTDLSADIAGRMAAADPRIRVYADAERRGKTQRLNQIYSLNFSDFLITIDADTHPQNEFVFEKMLGHMRADTAVGLVAANMVAMPGTTLVEKMAVGKERWWYEARKNFKGGHNIYASYGCCYAMPAGFVREFRFTSGTVNDLEIIYLEALRQGKRFVFADGARISFREVSTWKELVSRARRFEHDDDLAAYGFRTDIRTEYDIPLREKLRGFFTALPKDPFGVIGAVFLVLALKMWFFVVRDESPVQAAWEMILSTKQLHAPYGYFVRIVHEIEDADKRAWTDLWNSSSQAHFFNSPEFFAACRQAFGPKDHAVVFVSCGNELCAVLPLVRGRVFGVNAWFAPGSEENSVDMSPLLIGSHCERIMEGIAYAMSELGSVFLGEADETSSAKLKTSANGYLFSRRSSFSPYMRLSLEEDILRVMPRNQRRTLLNRLSVHQRHLSFRWAGVEALDTVIDVERMSYKSRLRMGLFRARHAASFLRAVEEHSPGSVQVGILFYDGEPIATNLGFVRGSRFYDYHTAYRDGFDRLGPGKILFYFTLQELFRRGIRHVDFLRGDHDLKKQFAPAARKQYDVYFSLDFFVLAWWRICIGFWLAAKSIAASYRKILRRMLRPRSAPAPYASPVVVSEK